MRLSLFFVFLFVAQAYATITYSQQTRLTIKMEGAKVIDVLNKIEDESEFFFLFNQKLVDVERQINLNVENEKIDQILTRIFENTNVSFLVKDRQIILTTAALGTEFNQQPGKQVSGKVTDSSGAPLPGVSVAVKGTTTGVITDEDGKYALSNIPDNATMQFSFVGMKTQEIIVGDKTIINVSLSEESIGIEEIVTIGYGTKKKVSMTTAVSTIAGKELAVNNRSDIRQVLQGMTPGLTISDFGGSPGSENIRVRIRGISSTNNTDPLILIDGVESWINSVNANEIESVSILKDAASTAIYGSRGANGVILITTKRGKSDGTFTAKYDMYYGLQNQAVVPEYATSEDYMRAINVANESVGANPPWTEENIQAYLDGEKKYPHLYPPAYTSPEELTEWSPVTNHSFIVSGGSKKVSSLFSASYQRNEGYFKTKSCEERYLTRLNTDFHPTDKISAFANFSIQKIDVEAARVDYFRATYYPYDFFSGIAPDGSHYPGISNRAVMTVLDVEQNGIDDNSNHNYTANIGGEIDIIDGLSFKSSLSVLINDWNLDRMIPKYEFYDYWNEDRLLTKRAQNVLTRSATNDIHTTLNSILTYSKTKGNHDFNALLGYSQDEYSWETTGAEGRDLYNNDLRSLGQSDVKTRNIWSDIQEWGLRSFFSRISYGFNGKYLVDISARYDGSSRFPKGNKYTFFPSAAVAWNINREKFWEPVSHLVSTLKLRASFGVNGNQNIGNYEYIDQLSLSNDYMFNGEVVNTVRYNTIASKDLSWEQTKQYNFGLDAGFWNNKLSLIFDIYNKETDGILMQLPMAGVVGLNASRSNAGVISNKGCELEVTWKNNVSDFNYSIALNGTYNKDILTDFAGLPDYTWDWQGQFIRGEGLPLFSTRGLIHEGLYNNQEEIDNGPEVFTRSVPVVPGDPKFKDVSGPEGVPDNKITNSDMVFLGSAVPKYTFGLNFNADYKNFFFSMFWQGAADFRRFLTHPFCAPMHWNDHVMLKVEADKYWRPDNQDAEWPAPHSGAFQGIWPSSRTNQDASYLRLRNINLGYSLPKEIISRIGLNKLQFYVGATNPLTISKFANYYGMDPEGGTEADYRGTYYFQSKSWRLGLSLEF